MGTIKKLGVMIERNEAGAEIRKYVNRDKETIYFVWKVGATIGMPYYSLHGARQAAGIEYKPVQMDKAA